MTYYCFSYVNAEKTTVSLYLRNRNEFIKAVNKARKQGFKPVKSIIVISDCTARKEKPFK